MGTNLEKSRSHEARAVRASAAVAPAKLSQSVSKGGGFLSAAQRMNSMDKPDKCLWFTGRGSRLFICRWSLSHIVSCPQMFWAISRCCGARTPSFPLLLRPSNRSLGTRKTAKSTSSAFSCSLRYLKKSTVVPWLRQALTLHRFRLTRSGNNVKPVKELQPADCYRQTGLATSFRISAKRL